MSFCNAMHWLKSEQKIVTSWEKHLVEKRQEIIRTLVRIAVCFRRKGGHRTTQRRDSGLPAWHIEPRLWHWWFDFCSVFVQLSAATMRAKPRSTLLFNKSHLAVHFVLAWRSSKLNIMQAGPLVLLLRMSSQSFLKTWILSHRTWWCMSTCMQETLLLASGSQ